MNLRGMNPGRFLKRIRKGLESRDDRVLGNLAVHRNLITSEELNEILNLPEVQSGKLPMEKALREKTALTSEQIESLLQEKRRQELLDFLQTRTEALPPEVEEAEFDPERNLGRYLLIHPIGRGGSAEVWKSWDRQMARWVAIKLLRTEILSPAIITRFQREAGLVGKLRHPNIVAVHDTGSWKDRPYIVMDLIEHGDLEKRNVQGQLNCAEILEKVARAVHLAHEHGIIHRDLKPGNILLDEQGEPLVTDFGLARSEREVDSITETGSVLGTPIYMAPEQVLGDKITARTDIYALGTILYEVLTGQRAFEESVLGELFHRITSGPLPSPPRTIKSSISSDLENICLRAMARDPLERYSSAFEFAEDLARFRRGQIPHAKPVSLPDRIVRWGKRNPLPTSLAVALLLVSVVGLTLFLTHQSEQENRLSALRRAQKAATAYAAGNYSAAEEEATESIRLDPTLSEGHFWAGRVFFHQYWRQRSLPSVAIFVDEIRFLPPPAESPEEKALLAKAKRAFLGISQNSFEGTHSWQWNASQGMLALVQQDYSKAENELRRAQEETHDREITYLLSLALYFQKKFEATHDHLDSIPSPREESVEIARIKNIHALAIEAQKAGKPAYALYEKALHLCRTFTPLLDPKTLATLEAHIRTTQAVYFYSTGRHLDQRKRFDHLLKRLESLPEKSIETDLMLVKASMVRGQIALRDGNRNLAQNIYARGLTVLNQIQKRIPPPPILPLLRANLLTLRAEFWEDLPKRERDIQDALEALQSLDSSLTGTSNEILIRSSLIALQSPRTPGLEQAVAFLEKEISTSPENPVLLIAKANYLNKLAERKRIEGENPRPAFRQAHKDLNRALDLPPVTHLLFDAEIRLATHVYLAGSLPNKVIENHQGTLTRILETLFQQEADSPRIPRIKALIHLLEASLLKRSREEATPHYQKGIGLLESLSEKGDDWETLPLLAEAWFRWGLAKHARGGNPSDELGKALEITRKREQQEPGNINIAIRVGELLLSKETFGPSEGPIEWKELETSLEELSQFVEKEPKNLLLRMKRANFAYQLATLKNRNRKPLQGLVELVIQDTTRCMKQPNIARKALMLRALIRGTYAIEAASGNKIKTALKQLDQCGLDFELILKQTPNYLQAYLFRAEIYFNALAQNPDGFLRLGGRTNVIGLLHVIYEDLLRVLAPSDNAQAFLLRAQVELLELFLNRGKTTKEEGESLAKRCQEDAKKGAAFDPARSRYVVLAGQFFEFKNAPTLDSQQRYQTLYQNLKQHLENHPELVSDQSNFLLRETESVLETDQD